MAPKFPFSGITPGDEIGNLAKLADYLVETQGFTREAAAGVASVVAGESAGNPESRQAGGGGGVGLIQWTPGSTMAKYGAHQPTGNATADFNNQLPAIVAYGKSRGQAQWDRMRSSHDAQTAASIWSQIEAPAQAQSDRRDNLILKILNSMDNPASGGGGGSSGGGSGINAGPTAQHKSFGFPGPLSFLGGLSFDLLGGGSVPSTIGDISQAIEDLVNAANTVVKWLTWLFNPANWLRIGAAIFGAIILGMGLYYLGKAVNPSAPTITETINKRTEQAGQLAMLAAK